ncbi:hypothetical protein ACF0H5_013585 [Mactra antiquata]
MDVKTLLATLIAWTCIFHLTVPVHGQKTKQRLKALEQQFATLNKRLDEILHFQQTLDVTGLQEQVEENTRYVESNGASLNKTFDALTSDLKNEVAETRTYIDSKVSTVNKAISDGFLILHQKIDKYQKDSVSTADVNNLLQEKKVAFSARLTFDINLRPEQVLVLSDVLTNDGYAYSSSTGVFTAPTSGTYAFSAHIVGSDRPNDIRMMHNKKSVMILHTKGSGMRVDGNMVVLKLTKGDQVKLVKNGAWGTPPFFVRHLWTSFSGHMLYAN